MIPSEYVEEKCQPFFNAFRDSYLSGVRKTLRRGLLINPEGNFTRMNVPKNRQPVNTNIRIHNITDDWFFMKFGFRARSQGIFCTSKEDVAKKYGFPFLVFPEGEFHVIHSTKVDDLFLRLDMYAIKKEYKSHYGLHEVEAFDSREELEEFFLHTIDMEKLRPVIYSILEKFDYRLDDFSGALQSENEIIVICDKYFASPTNNKEALNLLKSQIS